MWEILDRIGAVYINIAIACAVFLPFVILMYRIKKKLGKESGSMLSEMRKVNKANAETRKEFVLTPLALLDMFKWKIAVLFVRTLFFANLAVAIYYLINGLATDVSKLIESMVFKDHLRWAIIFIVGWLATKRQSVRQDRKLESSTKMVYCIFKFFETTSNDKEQITRLVEFISFLMDKGVRRDVLLELVDKSNEVKESEMAHMGSFIIKAILADFLSDHGGASFFYDLCESDRELFTEVQRMLP
jgi:hypothetical protein